MSSLEQQLENARLEQGAAPTKPPVRLFAGGDYASEAEAFQDFDSKVLKSGCFVSLSEVRGEIVQPRHGCEMKGVRIDRILLPTPKLVEAGWIHGPIGVEGKKSDEKMEKALSQAMDYSRALFDLGSAEKTEPQTDPPRRRMVGWKIMLDWIFLFPIDVDPGGIVSVMMQNRIGSISIKQSNRFSLLFRADAMHAIEIYPDGSVNAKALPMGRKAGNRG